MTQSIGQKLKQAREEQRFTLEQASEATRIRIPYLQALESGDMSVLPSPVQGRGFLRNYAEYLGLNIDQLLDEMRFELKRSDEIIGPADDTSQFPTQTSEPLTPQEAALPSSPELASVPQIESQPEPLPEKPKRRGRKKAESVSEPVVEELPQIPEEPVVIQLEPQIDAESLKEASILSQPEEINQPDINDNLWQTWLNRIASFRSVRAKSLASDDKSLQGENLDLDDLSSEDEALQPLQEDSSEASSLESNQIFKEIGADLRNRRELLSLHLEEVERNTHVKAHYLEALEKGALGELPSTVQTRGMLSNYATFLDMDVDALLLRYADALQARHREKNPQKTVRKPGQPIVGNLPPIRSFIAGDMVFGIGMAVLLIGFSIWGINRVLMIQSQQEIQPTAPSISDVLLASPDPSSITPTAALAPIESFQEPTSTIVIPTQNLNVNVQVNLVAVERTFMRVVVDGEEVFNGRVVPGTAYPFEAEEQIEILVGSGAAIRIVYNGRDLGLLGGLGQVVSNIYMADEIITPTAQPTPSPTPTVPVTSTVPSTLTPIPSNTPTP